MTMVWSILNSILYIYIFLYLDVITIDEVKPSAEQIDRAKKLQLPSTFYLYENKEPCKGCPGCEEDTPPLVPNESMFYISIFILEKYLMFI
jgi:hypothetical protein